MRISLTTRLSIMFMLAVVGVLSAAGVFFRQLSHHHFDELDRHTLNEKLVATEQILRSAEDGANWAALLPQLQALLGGHQDLYVLILDEDDQVLFSETGHQALHDTQLPLAQASPGEWRSDGKVWRTKIKQIETETPQQFTIVLTLDVTNHKAFFNTLASWLWIALFAFACIGALLGWLMARSGLRPLRDVTDIFASISAKSLQERIPADDVPPELRQMAVAFNDMLNRLEKAFARLSNFSADIAHELRTPVTNLMTHTEVVLTRARGADDYKENLYSNLEELRRMSRMIDDMLFLAKADNGLVIPQQQAVSLDNLCAALLEFYQIQADERGIRFSLEGTAQIRGDEPMLNRALSNVMTNALRHTPDGGRIEVALNQTAEHASVDITNPGETIQPVHLDRLFDRFYQADPARRDGSNGSAGLGLAITQSIIKGSSRKSGATRTFRFRMR
jgi:two-component system, OmpR family, heavy metal sensor histidine kinase CusS